MTYCIYIRADRNILQNIRIMKKWKTNTCDENPFFICRIPLREIKVSAVPTSSLVMPLFRPTRVAPISSAILRILIKSKD